MFTTAVVATGTIASLPIDERARTAISPRRNGASRRLRPAEVADVRIANRNPACRSVAKKDPAERPQPRLASVRPQAAVSHTQKPRRQSTLGDRASFERISAVATRPVMRTAAEAASRGTHAIERGDRLLMLADSLHGWCLENLRE